MASYGAGYPSPQPQYQMPGNMSSNVQPYSPPQGGQISPGSITYTTTTGPDGRLTYHCFKAIPASYQTPNGVVSGIQWVPAEATSVLPANAQPANAEFAASWNRGYLSKEEERALKDWQRSEEKRRRKEEKDSRGFLAYNQQRSSSATSMPSAVAFPNAADDTLRQARERDAQAAMVRERRKSFNAAAPYGGAAAAAGYSQTAYNTASGIERPRSPYAPQPTDRPRSPYGAPQPLDRPRSPYGAGGYQPSDRPRSPYAQPYSSLAERPRSPYMPAQSTHPSLVDRPRSPYAPTNDPSRSPYDQSRPPSSSVGGYPYSSNPYSTATTDRPRSPYGAQERPRSPYGQPPSAASNIYGSTNVSDMNRQFSEMQPFERERKVSNVGLDGRPTAARRLSGNFASAAPTGAGYPSSTASTAGRSAYSVYGGSSAVPGGYPSTSPRHKTVEFSHGTNRSDGSPVQRSRTPFSGPGTGGAQPAVYPKGHVMEGQPIPGAGAATGMGGVIGGVPVPFPSTHGAYPHSQGASPAMPSAALAATGEQLAAPDGFNRPINAALSYTPFEPMKIQNMDDFAHHLPKMPLVLQPHDVYAEDWIRLMQDIALAWAGRLPVPDLVSRSGRAPKRATLTADLIDLWNASFFLTRGVEMVLYKGRERRSGPNAGISDIVLQEEYDDDLDSDDDSSDSTSSEDDSNDNQYGDNRYGAPGVYGGVYGRPGQGAYGHGQADTREATRRKKQMKEEKKRRAKEKKIRKKAKEREKKYAIYLLCVPQGGPGGAGSYSSAAGGPIAATSVHHPSGAASSGGYGQSAAGYGQSAAMYGGAPAQMYPKTATASGYAGGGYAGY